MTLLCFRSFSI